MLIVIFILELSPFTSDCCGGLAKAPWSSSFWFRLTSKQTQQTILLENHFGYTATRGFELKIKFSLVGVKVLQSVDGAPTLTQIQNSPELGFQSPFTTIGPHQTCLSSEPSNQVLQSEEPLRCSREPPQLLQDVGTLVTPPVAAPHHLLCRGLGYRTSPLDVNSADVSCETPTRTSTAGHFILKPPWGPLCRGPLSSLTPTHIPLAPIGGEGLYQRPGVSGGGGGASGEEHFFRKSISEAAIDLGFEMFSAVIYPISL